MKVLLIAYYFPPSSAVGSRRYQGFYTELIRLGHDVTVLTANWQGSVPKPGIVRLGSSIEYTGSAKQSNGIINSYLIHPSEIFRSIDKTVFSEWRRESEKWITENQDFINEHDAVIVGYKPLACVLLGRLIKRKYNKPLIVDLRDLISQFGRKKRLPVIDFIDRLLDKYLISSSDSIIVTSYTSRKKACNFYKRNVHVITNGFSEEFSAEQDVGSDEVSIVYTGTLSDIRNPKQIYEFILQYNNNSNKKVYFDIASKQNPALYINNSMRYLRWHGYLSPDDTLNLQLNAAGFLLLEDLTELGNENIPAKLYEYIGLKKPIIAFCHPDSDVGIILRETGLGCIIANQEDFTEFINNLDKVKPNQEAIDNYSHRQTAMKLETLIKNTLSAKA